MAIRSVRHLLAAFVLINAALLFWVFLAGRMSHPLRVTFLDVGQGDAAVVESPSGKVLVIDTGGVSHDGRDDQGRSVVAPYLRARGIRRIDTLVLTHPHADHIGGALTLLDRFAVLRVLDNGAPDGEILAERIRKEAARRQVECGGAVRGQLLDFGDGVIARILAPTPAERLGDANDASVVLRLEYGRTRFLFTGDAEESEEEDLLHDRQPLEADVLKVGHHGSRTSTTAPFLRAAHPRLAVISVGKHNLYGHPDPEVLDLLRRRGTPVRRTDRCGAVLCVSDGAEIRVETMRSPAEHGAAAR